MDVIVLAVMPIVGGHRSPHVEGIKSLPISGISWRQLFAGQAEPRRHGRVCPYSGVTDQPPRAADGPCQEPALLPAVLPSAVCGRLRPPLLLRQGDRERVP